MATKLRRGYLFASTALVYLIALIGPFRTLNQIYFLFVLGVFSILVSTSRAVDQILVVAVSILGLIPVFGWIDTPTWFNPLQIIISGWFYIIAKNFDRKFEKTRMVMTLVPTLLAPILSFQWWRGFSEGTPVSVLTRILPIWDLSGHFLSFIAILLTTLICLAEYRRQKICTGHTGNTQLEFTMFGHNLRRVTSRKYWRIRS